MMRFDPARERALKAAALSPEQIRAGLPAGFFSGAIPAIGQGVVAGGLQTGGLLYGAAGSVVRGYNQVLSWQNDLSRWAGLPESGMVSTEWLDKQRDNALNLAQAYKPDPMKTGMAGHILFDLSRVMTQVGIGAGVAVATGGAGATALLTGAATTGGSTTYGKFAELKKAGVDDNTALQVAAIEGLVTGGGVVVPAALGFKAVAKAGLAKGTKSYLAANIGYGAGVNMAIGITERAMVSSLLAENYPAMAKHYQPLEASALIAEGALGAIFGAVGTHAGLRYRAQEITDAALTARAAKHAALDTAPGIPTDPTTANAHAKASNTAMEQLLNGEAVDVARTGISDGRFLPRPHAVFDADAAKPIKDDIRAQLDAVGKFDAEANDTYASIIGNYFAVQGHRLGIAPEELFKQYPLRVTGENAKVRGQKLRQRAIDDPDVFFQEDDYRMSHRPTESGARAHDITNNGEFIPADFYEHPEYYANLTDAYTRESLAVLRRIRNQPDAKIKVYRATPSDRINDGDWVTLSKTYAETHRAHSGDASWNIVEAEVYARDVQFAGDDINEFGYFPNSTVTHLEQAVQQPVATLTGTEIAPRDTDIKTFRAAAKQWYDANLRGKKVVNRASGREVEFRNAKKALHSSANPDKLRLFAALEQIVSEGEIKGSQPPHDPSVEGSTKAYHWLEADVSLDGQPVRVGVTIREDRNGNLYYNHNPIEKAPSSTRYDPPNKGGGGIDESAFNQTIPDDALNLQILDQPGARGFFTPSKNTISLLKNADLSTFLHETGHFFLEMQASIAGRFDAPAAHKADMQTVLDWFGVRNLNTWRSLSFEQKRAHHEKFARGFEAYLFESYSPSVELRNLFERVRDWLLKVYRDIKNLNVTLSDPVREVFDRMLATDEQIKRNRFPPIDDAIGEQFGTDASREANARINELLAIKDGPPVVLQNRDRSSAASIGQMNAIAGNPDYLRTGTSSTMDQGAPVVFGNADVLPDSAVMGGTQTVVDGRGERYETRYAVVEAQDILTSHWADGSPIPSYENGQAGKVRTVAGNGRAAGLLAAYHRGTADTYRAELRADLEKIGIDPQAIDAMQRPVLVRVMEEADVRPDIGDASNISASAALSPVEQAANDVRRVDIADFSFDDNGNPTPESVKAFVAAMPETERGALSNPDGSPTRQALDRIMAATFHQAYGNEELVRLFAQATKADAVNTINALAKAASRMARLAGTGEYDLRDIVAQAGVMAVNATRKGVTLAEFVRQTDLSTDPQTIVVAEFIARNQRSSSKIAEGLRSLADKAWEQVETLQTNMEQVGLFGEQPVLSREQVLQTLLETDNGGEARPTQAPSESASNRNVEPGGRGDHREVAGEHTAEPAGRSDVDESTRVDEVENPPDVIAPPEPLRITPKIKAELAQRFVTAGQVKPRFDAALARIAEDTGATLKTAPLKGVERAVAKILNDYEGNVSRIKDLVRATMIVNDAHQAAQVIQRVVRFLGGKVKRDNLSDDSKVPPTGYRDAFIMVEIDGFPAELQINVPEIMAAKEKAHPLYVKQSEIERKAKAQGRDESEAEKVEIRQLVAQQRELYTLAWEATKARNSTSSSIAPLWVNELYGNRRPLGTSQAVAETSSADTGTSSTSANKVPSGNDSGNSILGITDPPDAILPLTVARAGDDLETRAGLALLEERGDQVVPVELDDGQIVHLSPQEMLREADAELAHTNKATLDAAVQCALTHGA